MRFNIFIVFLLLTFHVNAQELFTWTEPASNMAAKGFGFRATNMLRDVKSPGKNEYQLLPEIMWGISGKFMMHVEAFLDNNSGHFEAKGAGLYFKYRVVSQDEVHSHLRMALFARGSFNNYSIHQLAINLNGDNSGYEAGLVATKLVNKIAMSAGGSFLYATDNSNGNKFTYDDKYRSALAYSLSLGKLMLPKEYTSYKQTNMNLMLELLGQTNFGNGETYLDLAPTIQFIILSKMRIDAGYRFAMIKSLERNATSVFLLRLEYNIFNAYK